MQDANEEPDFEVIEDPKVCIEVNAKDDFVRVNVEDGSGTSAKVKYFGSIEVFNRIVFLERAQFSFFKFYTTGEKKFTAVFFRFCNSLDCTLGRIKCFSEYLFDWKGLFLW